MAWPVQFGCSMTAGRNSVALETLKLLVSVAWADHEITPEESEYLCFLVEQMGPTEAEMELLQGLLCDEGRLPAADLSLLRDHREHVLQSVDHLIGADQRLTTDEAAVRKAIELILEDKAVS